MGRVRASDRIAHGRVRELSKKPRRYPLRRVRCQRIPKHVTGAGQGNRVSGKQYYARLPTAIDTDAKGTAADVTPRQPSTPNDRT